MIFEQLRTGGDRTFTYIVADEMTREAAIVDPGYDAPRTLARTRELGLKVKFCVNTHDHFDHTGGNDDVLRMTGAQLARFGGGDLPVADGSVLRLGALELAILHTPGHTPDSISIVVQDRVMTGDTLFVGKVGGTYSPKAARDEYASLHDKLMKLPGHYRVFPGHDYGLRPYSTIAEEMTNNPFLRQKNFGEFLHLKNNWDEYKRQHGIK